MKSLQRVQKAANVLRILAKIGYILTIVGTIFCVLGAIFCGIFGSNVTVREWLAKEGTTFVTREYVCYCVCAAIGCASGTRRGHALYETARERTAQAGLAAYSAADRRVHRPRRRFRSHAHRR